MSYFEKIYSAATLPYGDAPDAFLDEHLRSGAGAALDAGGGTGRNAALMARRGYHVELLDAAAPAVESARALAEREGLAIDAQVADLRGWQPEHQYEVVVCGVTLHAFKAHRANAVAQTLRDAVTPNGEWFISVHLAGGDEQRMREEANETQIEPRTYLIDGRHMKRLFTLEEARALLGWKPRVETIAEAERCPRAQCPHLHRVYRAIAARPPS